LNRGCHFCSIAHEDYGQAVNEQAGIEIFFFISVSTEMLAGIMVVPHVRYEAKRRLPSSEAS
jgi:hypothetical protein